MTTSEAFAAANAWVRTQVPHEAAHAEALADASPDLLLAQRQAMLSRLLTAQVELCCAHEGAALAVVRAVQRQLLNPGQGPQQPAVLTALDEAAWHIHRHHTHEAMSALDRARQTLN